MVAHRVWGAGIRNDNRWMNLRKATRIENRWNQKKPAGNNEIVGVSWDIAKKKWRAQIKINRQAKHLGYFIKMMDAVRVRREAEKEHYKEFAP